MDPRQRKLQRRIARAQAQSRRQYGAALKRDIVAYTVEKMANGATIRGIATEFNLSATRLGLWLRHAQRRQKAGLLPFEPRRKPKITTTLSHKTRKRK